MRRARALFAREHAMMKMISHTARKMTPMVSMVSQVMLILLPLYRHGFGQRPPPCGERGRFLVTVCAEFDHGPKVVRHHFKGLYRVSNLVLSPIPTGFDWHLAASYDAMVLTRSGLHGVTPRLARPSCL